MSKIVIKMTDVNIIINVKMTISDLNNYTYSENIIFPKFEKNPKSEFIFPTNTHIDNELIVLTD